MRGRGQGAPPRSIFTEQLEGEAMKFLSLLVLAGAAALSGCSTTGNNANGNGNANLRGTNTNTAYVTNSDSNVKPTVPANATNITPGNLTTGNATSSNTNSNANRTPARNN
jgi:hypothetical protein